MFYVNNIHVMSVKANNPELSLTPGQSPNWWEIVRETMLKCHRN